MDSDGRWDGRAARSLGSGSTRRRPGRVSVPSFFFVSPKFSPGLAELRNNPENIRQVMDRDEAGSGGSRLEEEEDPRSQGGTGGPQSRVWASGM